MADSSAIVAAMQNESGAEVVASFIGTMVMSTVNYGEVYSVLSNKGITGEAVDQQIEQFDLRLFALWETTARAAGLLRPSTKRLGLSFADRVAIALGVELGMPILIGDRAWTALDLPVPVVLIR